MPRIIPPQQFGRDHWAMLAYLFTRIAAGGTIDPRKVRMDGESYPTRVFGVFGEVAQGSERGHSDIDCMVDLEHAGVLKNQGTYTNPRVRFTTEGLKLAEWLVSAEGKTLRASELHWDTALERSDAVLGLGALTPDPEPVDVEGEGDNSPDDQPIDPEEADRLYLLDKAGEGDNPTLSHLVAVVRFRGYPGDMRELATRIRQCIETHPTLSLPIDEVAVDRVPMTVPPAEPIVPQETIDRWFARDDWTDGPAQASAHAELGIEEPAAGLSLASGQSWRYQPAKSAPPTSTSTAILDDLERGRQSASAGEARIPPSGVFWDAWLSGYDEVAGKPSIPLALAQFKGDNAPSWSFWWESNSIFGWVCSPLDWDAVWQRHTLYPEDLAKKARQAVFDHGAVVMHAGAQHSYGLRREHTGARTLYDHAQEHKLLWLIHANPLDDKASPPTDGPPMVFDPKNHPPIVAYDPGNPPRLQARYFKPGSRVFGDDNGTTLSGSVSDDFDPEKAGDDVLVYWDTAKYTTSSKGHVVPAKLLRLWPWRAHREALFASAEGPDLDVTAGIPREPDEDDDAFRRRAYKVWLLGPDKA